MEKTIAPPPPDTNEPANPGMATFADIEAMAESQNQALSSQGLEGQGDQQETVLSDEQPPAEQDKVTSDIEALVGELGFKTPEDLKKSYKEQHATITKLSQERSNMAREMEAIRQMVMAKMQQPAYQPAQGQGDDLNLQLYKEIAPLVQQEVNHAVKYNMTVQQVMAKRAQNPEEFDELQPYMTQIAQANPHLENMADGLNVVYEKAKEFRNTYVRKNLASVLGVDIERLQSLLATPVEPPKPTGNNLSEAMTATSVPGASGSRSAVDQKIDYTSEIKKAQAANDIDKVVALSFARAQRKAK